MDEPPRRRTAPRWPVTLGVTPLCAQEEPVALVVKVNSDPHAWDRQQGQIRSLPDVERRMPPSVRDRPVAGGRHLLMVREGWNPDETVDYNQRRTGLGIYRYCVATGALERAGFDPPPGPMHSTYFTASPDGEQMLTAQGWTHREPGHELAPGQPSPRHLSRLTLWMVDFAGTPPRELLTVSGYAREDADDLAVQWSPDGTAIAVSLALYQGPEVPARSQLLILDAHTGQETSRIDGVGLAGSASWSPDCQHLLVIDDKRVLWICDLRTGQQHLVPTLPGNRPGSWVDSSKRALGILDDRRLLIAVLRQATMTISTLDRDTGETVPLVRWAGAPDMYPVLAQMPPTYWDQTGR